MCVKTLLSCWWNLRIFGALVFKLLIFVHNCQKLYVIIYVYSFRVLTYNCTFVHMTTLVWPSVRKNFFCSTSQLGNVLILEFNMLSPSTCILSPLVFMHVEALSYSLYRYPCHDYFDLSIMNLFFLVLLTTFWINTNVTFWVCICIACAFGNLGWTNMHTHGRFQYSSSILLMIGGVFVP
jgi:hypothetical protein